MRQLPYKSFLILAFLAYSIKATAQLVPDSSLGTNSIVVPNQIINSTPSDLINGGAVRGQTLFHSFRDFNILFGRGVYFSNPTGINQIITRVTGGNSSSIQGTLGVLGSANLILINPNGINFGPAARLDISGSFLGSTASSIQLNNSRFSALNPQPVPLLTESIPLGLNFEIDAQPINIQGSGHNIVLPSGLLPGVVMGAGKSTTGLRVAPGKAIALIGGNVNLDGGIITVPSGQIELGSVAAGTVAINSLPVGWSFSYSSTTGFKNIQLNRLSLLDASGAESGRIILRGDNVSFFNGSFALIQNLSTLAGGEINVSANTLRIVGNNLGGFISGSVDPGTQARSGIVSYNEIGKGANITISAKNLIIDAGGGVTTESIPLGVGGDISINSTNSIQNLAGPTLIPFYNGGIIASNSAGSASAGSLSITTKQLINYSNMGTATYGGGTGAEVKIDAESVLVDGFNLASNGPHVISSFTAGSGKGGDIIINAKQVTVQNGAFITTSTVNDGEGGTVTINADSIKVDGSVLIPKLLPANISSSALPASDVSPELQMLLNAPSLPSGKSGFVNLKTGSLNVSNGGQISVNNRGTNDGGKLDITTSSIRLSNGGQLTAFSKSGTGGNIEINSSLLVISGSQISASAASQAGGKVVISSQGVFKKNSGISATGGIAASPGIVQFNTPFIEFTRSTSKSEATPQSPQVKSVCQGNGSTKVSQLISTGSGGLPANPNNLASNVGWQDNSLLTSTPQQMPNQIQVPVLREVKGWVKHNGIVTLLPTLDRAAQTSSSSICPSTK